jgi:hypothetical protein
MKTDQDTSGADESATLEMKGAADGGKKQAQTGRAAWGVLGSAAGRACFGLVT